MYAVSFFLGLMRRPPTYIGRAVRHVINAYDKNSLNLKFLQRALINNSSDRTDISESIPIKSILDLSEAFRGV
jgi:hypothetical protein